MGLMIHCGGRRVTEAELADVPTPERTPTYTPIPFIDLVELTKERIVKEFGSGVQTDVAVGVNAKETQMFGVVTILDGDKRLPNVGLRSSHDRSIAPGVVGGMTLTVCDNLVFSGDSLKIMRKHTGDAWGDLELLIMGGIAKLESEFNMLDTECQAFEEQDCPVDRGYELLGLMQGWNLLTSVQVNEAMRHWKAPIDAYRNRNAWSFYNAVTYGLKKGQPARLLGQYKGHHRFMRQRFLGFGHELDIEDAELADMAEVA